MARIVRERISWLCQRFRIEPNAGGLVSCKQLVWGSGIWCVLDISIDVLHKDKLLTCIHRHVSGYGVVPVIFNIRDSMAEKQYIGRSTQIGLGMVYFGYLFISNGVRVLFSPTHSFDGDVLQALPATWIALVVRLLMTFVVAVTAPLIVVPCGELIEGKLGLETTGPIYKRRCSYVWCARSCPNLFLGSFTSFPSSDASACQWLVLCCHRYSAFSYPARANLRNEWVTLLCCCWEQ